MYVINYRVLRMDDSTLLIIWSGVGYLVALCGSWGMTQVKDFDETVPAGITLLGLFVCCAFLSGFYFNSGGFGLFDSPFNELSEIKQFSLVVLAVLFYLLNYLGLMIIPAEMIERRRVYA